MSNNPIYIAAALLDDLASGTLDQRDFYLCMEEAGLACSQLCKLVLRDRMHEDSVGYQQIMNAAECLKDICIAQDNDKLKSALASAKMHSENLYWINERMGQI